jgi:hypothetical protein
LDFIGEFYPRLSNGYKWILITTYYFSIWVEAIPTKRDIEEVVMEFLEEKIITQFGVLPKITTENAQAFKSIDLVKFCLDYGIVLFHSSNYYPRGIGIAYLRNKQFDKDNQEGN